MRLLDRESELEQLTRALAQASRGTGGVVQVTGEAGIGKTSLLRAFLGGIHEDVRVLRGACEDLRVAEPLGPLRDLLREAEPELAEEIETSDKPFALFSDVVVACATNPGGTVIIIEDLHWADEATIDFVRFLGRRVAEHPILLVVSSRAEEARARQQLRRTFGDIPTETLHRIELDPLSKSAVEELCRGLVSDPDGVYSASGGNAFYVTELLQNAGDTLPLSIRDAVLARVDRLGLEARAVLEAASAIPRRAEIEHVTAVLADDVDPERAVETCLDAGLLTFDGTYLSFQHEIAREAVASSLSLFKSRALHRRLLDRMRQTGETSFSRLLHHAQGAGDTAAVAELAPQAARAASTAGALREAAKFYALAVSAIGEACEADFLEEAAAGCYLGTDHTLAASYQSRALDLIGDKGDPVRRGDGLRRLSRYRWVQSDFPGAFEAIHESIRVLANRRGPELAQAYSSLSQVLMTGYRLDEVEEPATRAIELAREFDRPDIISHALNNLGMSMKLSNPEKARELMAESIDIAQRIGNPDHVGRGMGNWMSLEFEICEFERALHRAQIAAKHMIEQDLEAYHYYSQGMIARASHELGLWDNVVEIAQRGFDPDDRVPSSFYFFGAIALFAHQIRTGTEPDRDVEEYLALFDHDASEAQRIGPFAELTAERAWLAGVGLESASARLAALVERHSYGASIAGSRVWLKRLGAEIPDADLSLYSDPYRLELNGDLAGAAQAWADRKAPYRQALTLAFGTPEQQAEALAIFESLGAQPAIAKLSEMTGTQPKTRRGRPPAAGPHGLTGRQVDVLRLLGDGLTNSQIGETLFISPKTVDHHVSAILDRLDAASRGEAAAKARRLGLLE